MKASGKRAGPEQGGSAEPESGCTSRPPILAELGMIPAPGMLDGRCKEQHPGPLQRGSSSQSEQSPGLRPSTPSLHASLAWCSPLSCTRNHHNAVAYDTKCFCTCASAVSQGLAAPSRARVGLAADGGSALTLCVPLSRSSGPPRHVLPMVEVGSCRTDKQKQALFLRLRLRMRLQSFPPVLQRPKQGHGQAQHHYGAHGGMEGPFPYRNLMFHRLPL